MLLLACVASPEPSPVADVHAEAHPEVSTILEVGWTQVEDRDRVWVEYGFDEESFASPAEAALAGEQTVPLLGLPADTETWYRIVQDGVAGPTRNAVTGSLPEDSPRPELLTWEAELADPGRWLLTTVDTGPMAYSGPFWVLIFDRLGRVVWYRALDEHRSTIMTRVSADGSHLTWGEADWVSGEGPSLERSTLDLGWTESVSLPDFGYTYDELADGTIAFDAWELADQRVLLREQAPDGTTRDLWDCTAEHPEVETWPACGTNTVNYSEERDSWLWSLYAWGTVIEIDRSTGSERGSWGDLGVDPIDAGLQMQHFPNWTEAGTLLLHTQEVGEEQVEWAREFEWSEEDNSLRQIWSYSTDERYAECSGEAVRLDNGNTLINYGCGGIIREIGPDGTLVWEVDAGHLLGHQVLLDDLYAVNRGRE